MERNTGTDTEQGIRILKGMNVLNCAALFTLLTLSSQPCGTPTLVATNHHASLRKDIRNNPTKYKITLGKTDISTNPSGSLTLKPIKVIIHNKYNPFNFENDIALLKLPYPVTFTDTIKPLCVARDKDIPFGSTSVATGWGVKKFGAIKFPKVMHEVTLDVISEKRCQSLAGANKRYFICGLTKKKDTCQGDSGGPLMVEVGAGKWAQVGIVSHGEGCALKNSPGVYTRVPAYLSWIASKTKSKNC